MRRGERGREDIGEREERGRRGGEGGDEEGGRERGERRGVNYQSILILYTYVCS